MASIAIFILGAVFGTMLGVALTAIVALPDRYVGDQSENDGESEEP